MFIAERTWASVEELQALLEGLGLNLQLLQLEGGALGGSMLSVAVPPLQLIHLRLNRRLHSLGPKPREVLTVSLDLDPGGAEGWIQAHGQSIAADSLFGLDPNREVHLTLPAHVNLGMVFLPLPALRRWGERLSWPGFDGELLSPENVVRMDRLSAGGLRKALQQLFALARRDSSSLRSPASQQRVLEDLMPLLLEAMVSGFALAGPPRRPPPRIGIVKEVQRWMHSHPTGPITLTDLCLQAHASRRTLIQGFQDHLGMGPMAYLKLLRLHGIRQRLLQADPAEVQIGPVACEWGFFNAGHFAADYRRLFGERPRDTLRRVC